MTLACFTCHKGNPCLSVTVETHTFYLCSQCYLMGRSIVLRDHGKSDLDAMARRAYNGGRDA